MYSITLLLAVIIIIITIITIVKAVKIFQLDNDSSKVVHSLKKSRKYLCSIYIYNSH